MSFEPRHLNLRPICERMLIVGMLAVSAACTSQREGVEDRRALLASSEASADDDDAAPGPREGDFSVAALSARGPLTKPTFTAAAACPVEVICSAADWNGDGQMDVIRRDPQGRIGPAGQLSVALANGWGFVPFRAVDGSCRSGTTCLVADARGSRQAELIRLEHASGRVTISEFSPLGNKLGEKELAAKGFCLGTEARCDLVQLDADQQPELVWLDQAGVLRALDTKVPGGVKVVASLAKGSKFRFAETDGAPGSELATWDPKAANPGISMRTLAGSEVARLAIDCASVRCDFVDVDGDARADVVQHLKSADRVWGSRKRWLEYVDWYSAAACRRAERCFWADGNADGFDDLFRIDEVGTLFYHPNLDRRGRLEEATLELSVLSTLQARARLADRLAAEAVVVGSYAPERVPPRYEGAIAPLSDSAYAERHAGLTRRVTELSDDLLAAIPREEATLTDADVRQIRELGMYVVAGRTVLNAVPLGLSRRGGDSCGNAVVHDRTLLGGEEQRAPSYLFAFARALAPADVQPSVELAVGAMTAIVGGFRCLNNEELAILDAALADAVLTTAHDLRASGRVLASKWIMDSALPLVLLTFDAVKYTRLPISYRLLTARVGSAVEPGELPELGASGAPADPACQTFLCQTYGRAERADGGARGLVLDRLGVWLPDPLASARLTRADVDPSGMLRALTNLRNLGEGDCALFEVAQRGFACPSARTCASANLAADPMAGLGIPAGVASVPPEPGGLGSPFTHLFTSRGEGLSERNGCGGSSSPGGGGVMGDCMGPPLGSRGGRFSPDPELDRVMRCTLDAASAPVDVSLEPGADCLASHDSPVNLGDPRPPEPTAQELTNLFPALRAQIVEMLRSGGSVTAGTFSFSRDELVAGIQSGFSSAPRLTEANIVSVLSTDVADSVEDARIASVTGGIGETTYEGGSPSISVDIADHARMLNSVAEVLRTLIHEAVHAFLSEAETRGWVRQSEDPETTDHRITRRMGLGGLCESASDCASSCAVEDARIARFQSCVDAEAPVDFQNIRCEVAMDLCEGHEQGALQYALPGDCTGTASLAPEPDCLVVNCGADSGVLAGACCGGGAAEVGSIRAFERMIGPGPRPPRPVLDVLPAFDGEIVGLPDYP